MSPQKFWMVWLQDSPTTRVRHPDPVGACEEANRIARLPQNHGKKVYVLEAVDFRWVQEAPLTYETL